MRSPIRWIGGKYYMLKYLLPLIPKHKRYIEVFFGAGHLFFAKEPVEFEVINDINSHLINLYRVIRDKDKYEELVRLCSLTPYSRDEYCYSRDRYRVEEDEVKRAYYFMVAVSMCFGGKVNQSWGYGKYEVVQNMNRYSSVWINKMDKLPLIHKRLMRTLIDNRDFRDILNTYDLDEHNFFYLDPPYLESTRKTFNDYDHEMSDQDHIEMINILKQLKGKWLLSGYRNEIYDEMLKGYPTKDFNTITTVANPKDTNGTRDTRIETVWANYELDKQMSLFDANKKCSTVHKLFTP